MLPFKESIYLERKIFKSFKKIYKIKDLINKLENVEVIAKVVYLEKSKVIINGGNKFYNIIQDWFKDTKPFKIDI